MKEVSRNFLVGLFVITALGALATLMFWFGEAPSWLSTAEWKLEIHGVSELSGIREGSSVCLNGIEIGRVQSLQFKNPNRPDLGVVIVCGIKREYTVPVGAKAKVYGATLGLGTGHIEIVMGPEASTEPLDRDDARIAGEMRSKLGEIVSKSMLDDLQRTISRIGDLTTEWAPVGTNLAQLFEQRPISEVDQPGAAEGAETPNLSTLVQRIDRLAAHVDEVLGDGDVQEDIRKAIEDLRRSMEEFRETVTLWKSESRTISDKVQRGLDETSENLDESFVNLNKVLEHLNDASKNVASTLQTVSEGKGTAGLLTHDDRLYEAGVLSLERLAEALATLQRILGNIEEDGYITLKQAPPGVFKKEIPIPSARRESP